MRKKNLQTIALVLVLLSSINTALALLASWTSLGGVEFVGFVGLVIDQYSIWAHFFFWWVTPVILYVVGLLNPFPEFGLTIGEHAVDFFVFFWSYIAAFASVTYRLNGLWRLAAFYLIWGILVALLVSALVGFVDLNSYFRSLVLPLGFVMATAIFSVGTSLRAAVFFPPDGYPTKQAFKHYSRHAWRYLVFGLLATALTYLSFLYIFRVAEFWNEVITGLAILTVVYTLLGAYRFALGPKQGNFHTVQGGWLESRLKSGEGLTGFSILSSTFVVALGLVISALQGLQ